jgi:hypothetical protein
LQRFTSVDDYERYATPLQTSRLRLLRTFADFIDERFVYEKVFLMMQRLFVYDENVVCEEFYIRATRADILRELIYDYCELIIYDAVYLPLILFTPMPLFADLLRRLMQLV